MQFGLFSESGNRQGNDRAIEQPPAEALHWRAMKVL